jgi:hypothetical protein
VTTEDVNDRYRPMVRARWGTASEVAWHGVVPLAPCRDGWVRPVLGDHRIEGKPRTRRASVFCSPLGRERRSRSYVGDQRVRFA